MCFLYRLQVLQQPLTTPTASSPSHFWQCCYGSHPQSIVLAEHCGVSLGDFRVLSTHTHTHTHTITHTHTLTHYHSHTHTLTHIITPTHYHTHTHTHYHTHTITHIHHSHTHYHSHTLSLTYITHTHTITHTHYHSHTLSHTHIITPTHYHSPQCSKLIFSLMMSSSDLPHNTLISSVTPSSTNSHHHIYLTTTHSLMLIDIRQPQYTLLQLSHDLNHTPKIMDTISYSVNGDMCECVMLCDCVSGDSMIFTMATTNPPTINASPHAVAKYRYNCI